jgi:hypothetical protein
VWKLWENPRWNFLWLSFASCVSLPVLGRNFWKTLGVVFFVSLVAPASFVGNRVKTPRGIFCVPVVALPVHVNSEHVSLCGTLKTSSSALVCPPATRWETSNEKRK